MVNVFDTELEYCVSPYRKSLLYSIHRTKWHTTRVGQRRNDFG